MCREKCYAPLASPYVRASGKILATDMIIKLTSFPQGIIERLNEIEREREGEGDFVCSTSKVRFRRFMAMTWLQREVALGSCSSIKHSQQHVLKQRCFAELSNELLGLLERLSKKELVGATWRLALASVQASRSLARLLGLLLWPKMSKRQCIDSSQLGCV